MAYLIEVPVAGGGRLTWKRTGPDGDTAEAAGDAGN
jgi:hypothetical protein